MFEWWSVQACMFVQKYVYACGVEANISFIWTCLRRERVCASGDLRKYIDPISVGASGWDLDRILWAKTCTCAGTMQTNRTDLVLSCKNWDERNKHTSLPQIFTHHFNMLLQRKINCSTKPQAIDKLISANESHKQTLSIHSKKLITNPPAPFTISTNTQKCDISLNLRAFETGASNSESYKRWQKDRSIRGSNPGPFPSLQRSAALIMLSPKGVLTF